MNTFCECILKKIGLTHAHFQYNSRKLVNVVKVRFTMMYSSRKLTVIRGYNHSLQLLKTNCLFFPGLWPHKPLLRQVDAKNSVWNFPLFFTWPTLTSQAVFSDNFSDRFTKIRAKKQQFLIANISEILASIELKLHSMFIWFILDHVTVFTKSVSSTLHFLSKYQKFRRRSYTSICCFP